MIEKILFQHEIFGHDRCLLQFSVGTMPHDKIMRSIELFGTEVAPAVRRELAARTAADRRPLVAVPNGPDRGAGRTAGARHRGSNCRERVPRV